MKLKWKQYVAIAAILCAGSSVAYSTRVFIPLPNYVMRLNWLNGWASRGYYGFNCSGFLTNAHGEQFMNERQMYAGNAKIQMVKDLDSRYQINEAELQPGDIAAFQGPEGLHGLHVAAYLKPGVWIDADSRRGYVTKYDLSKVPANDQWFMGRVHIMRWTSGAKFTLNLGFYGEAATHMQ